ncbi:hypothetical protein BDN71DRAFT_359758 [Pleurotus eryngii]|uniref:HPP transmembrane region domain-containing protein n=1 Tax=Pleurotus eryngii TaxID=5323 RepID=A0A9P5ZLC3_PLEER|nr:hypothetical protein BDN71DRAFT_359758 [Pleurotus eryngii]
MTRVYQPKHPHLAALPWWMSRWIGYRPYPVVIPPLWVNCVWSFIAVFCGIATIQTIFTHVHFFVNKEIPPVIANYVASVGLIGALVNSPFAQPRPMFCGHMIGAVTGICITKLMELLPEEQFLQFRWLAGSTSCATTLVLMQMTNNRHPPACSTAILVAIDNNLRTLSWSFIPIILLTATVSLCITLFINNIQRRYPAFWLYPGDLDEPAPIVAEEDDPTTRVNSTVDLPKTIQDKSPV